MIATRRAAPFYPALGYEESATYLRKVLPSRAEDGSGRPATAGSAAPAG
jgi:hypothetical protein